MVILLTMMWSKMIDNESYIYRNGELIHKTRCNNSQSGITFDITTYRKCDILKTIK
jgi:hypothetical protein